MTLRDSAFVSIPITSRAMRSLFLSASVIRFSVQPLVIQGDDNVGTCVYMAMLDGTDL
jgi:hypothetical protein